MFIYLYSSLLVHVCRYTHYSFMFATILTYSPSLIHVHCYTHLLAFTHSCSPLFSPTRLQLILIHLYIHLLAFTHSFSPLYSLTRLHLLMSLTRVSLIFTHSCSFTSCSPVLTHPYVSYTHVHLNIFFYSYQSYSFTCPSDHLSCNHLFMFTYIFAYSSSPTQVCSVMFTYICSAT